MTEDEFWLLVEVKKQTAGGLTDEDYESIDEFVKSRPKQSPSIKHGKR